MCSIRIYWMKAKTVKTAILPAVLWVVQDSPSLPLTTQSTCLPGLWINFALAHKGKYIFISIDLEDFTGSCSSHFQKQDQIALRGCHRSCLSSFNAGGTEMSPFMLLWQRNSPSAATGKWNKRVSLDTQPWVYVHSLFQTYTTTNSSFLLWKGAA